MLYHRVLPVPEQLEAEPASETVKRLVARSHEYAHGKETVCEAVSVLDIRMKVLDKENVHVNTFRLHQPSDIRNVRQYHQGRLVSDVPPYVIFGRVVPVAVQQLELPRPVVIPSSGYVLFLKVNVIKEIRVMALGSVEPVAESH